MFLQEIPNVTQFFKGKAAMVFTGNIPGIFKQVSKPKSLPPPPKAPKVPLPEDARAIAISEQRKRRPARGYRQSIVGGYADAGSDRPTQNEALKTLLGQ